MNGRTTPTRSRRSSAGERADVHADHIGASTFIEKGWSKISLGDYEGAEQALSKALELSPNDPQAESLLGWAQMLQEKYDDALLNFQKVLMREPANALARINVGYICLKKRIFGEAIEHLSSAIRLDNDRKATLYAHFYLGLVYLERDMYEDAQTFFQKTLVLGPESDRGILRARSRATGSTASVTRRSQTWRDGLAANKFNPWGKRCAEVLKTVEEGGEPWATAASRRSRVLLLASRSASLARASRADAPAATRSRAVHGRLLPEPTARSRTRCSTQAVAQRHLSRSAAAHARAC